MGTAGELDADAWAAGDGGGAGGAFGGGGDVGGLGPCGAVVVGGEEEVAVDVGAFEALGDAVIVFAEV